MNSDAKCPTSFVPPHGVTNTFLRDVVTSHGSARLSELGLPAEALRDLSQAIDQDSAFTSAGEAGPATKRWLGDIGTKVALGTLHLGQAATAAVVTAEVLHFLGLR